LFVFSTSLVTIPLLPRSQRFSYTGSNGEARCLGLEPIHNLSKEILYQVAKFGRVICSGAETMMNNKKTTDRTTLLFINTREEI
jgi:hypothetical protein